MIRSVKGYAPEVDETAYVDPGAHVIGNVKVGAGASIWPGAVLRGDMNRIEVGARTSIQDGAVVHNTFELPAIIGSDVTVGHGAILHACTVRDRSLIGMGAIVLDGAEVGEECIIGAGALVPPGKVIPPRSVVMGVPGKVVRELTPEELKMVRERPGEYMGLVEKFYRGEES